MRIRSGIEARNHSGVKLRVDQGQQRPTEMERTRWRHRRHHLQHPRVVRSGISRPILRGDTHAVALCRGTREALRRNCAPAPERRLGVMVLALRQAWRTRGASAYV